MYDEAGEQIGTVRDEPLLRMLLRYDGIEAGGTVTDGLGRAVQMDAQERGKMWGKGGSDIESAKVARVATTLHLVHGFTDVAATDGSKGEQKHGVTGKWETRVGCGVYEGVRPGGERGGQRAEEAGGATEGRR